MPNVKGYLKQNIKLRKTIKRQIRDKLMSKDDDLNQGGGLWKLNL
ncbi:hypothetical protein [uncultured Gammaproteobacteria bacterium]|nr:hypothetical protein [uncultured Gammaproteobacteria bacterium]CAC9626569.1 hypothetical protein [uncultured Gammaproteobacteria bacterium]